MNPGPWDKDKIKDWVDSQSWYQTIPLPSGIVTPGSTDSLKRLELLNLNDLSGKSVLDIGCNSGMYSLESKKRNAARVVGIDIEDHRLDQARTVAQILNLDVEFKHLELFEAPTLGTFDVVFCFAVLTEIPDLMRALSVLKSVTRETLYLELDVFLKGSGPKGYILKFIDEFLLGILAPKGVLGSRKSKSGLMFSPNLRFIHNAMGDEFTITDLGPSARYRLLKLNRI